MLEFNVCTERGCESTSVFSFDKATTLRLGYKFCVELKNELVIKERPGMFWTKYVKASG